MPAANTTTSFKIPHSLEIEMNKKLVADGYGLREKSKWICDVLCHFLTWRDKEFILECVELSDELEKLDKTISFRPTEQSAVLLNEWIIRMRLRVPTLEGLRGKIIRTAIIHAILGSLTSIEKISHTRKK